jgi:hypothetical protein
VRAFGTPEPLAPEAAVSSAASHVRMAEGVIIGGTPAGDVVVVSQRALALVRAGSLVKAYIKTNLAALRRTVRLGGQRTLLLQHGVYQLV